MSSSVAVVIAVVSALVATGTEMILWIRGKHHPPPGELRYSKAQKVAVLAAGLGVAGPLAALLARWSSVPIREQWAAWLLGASFLGAALPAAIEYLFVEHRYDEEGLFYRTPWSPERRLLWAEVARVEWKKNWKWLLIRDTHGASFRFKPRLGGLQALAETALRRIQPAVLEASPGGAAALKLLQRGMPFLLPTRKRTPEQILGLLPPPRPAAVLSPELEPRRDQGQVRR